MVFEIFIENAKRKRLGKNKQTAPRLNPPPQTSQFIKRFPHTRHLRLHPLIQLPGPVSFSCT